MNRFSPPWYLQNGHLQTILNSLGPRNARAKRSISELGSSNLTLQADDGTRLLAEFDSAHSPRQALVVLIHGWEGSSRSAYMVTTASDLLLQGYDVLRLNLRDHGDSHHLNRDLFNSTLTPEVASALQNYLGGQSYAQIYLGGFSLGASFALRIAADNGTDLGLTASFGICPPVDPANAMRAMNRGFRVYADYFFKKWRDSLQRKLSFFPDFDYAEWLSNASTLDDLNHYFIPKYTEYAKVEDYFAAYALYGSRLSAMAQPAFLLAAQDDPIIPVEDLKRIDAVANLNLEVTRFGGHCGYVDDLAGGNWIGNWIADKLEKQR